MTPPQPRFAQAVVRVWAHIYTWRLEPVAREARLAEIESDLWECQQDPNGGRGLGLSKQIIIRMVLGMPHDLSWRAEHVSLGKLGKTITLGSMAALLLAALWVFDVTRTRELPTPPPLVRFVAEKPPPPPPPPPPEFRLRD